MKKIFKVLIALLIIVVITVGIYFIFFKKNNNKLVYANIIEFNNEIKMDNKNIVTEINDVVARFPQVVEQNQISGLTQELNFLTEYTIVFEEYQLINEEILNNCFLVKNAKSKYVKKATKDLKAVKEIYLDSYKYLKDTYYQVINSSYTKEQMKSYIQNFYKLFKEINIKLSSFYYNSAIAYAHGVEDTMFVNSLYKLNVEYYVNVANYAVKNNKVTEEKFSQVLERTKSDIKSSSMHNTYFKNKSTFDNLLKNSLKINIYDVLDNDYKNNSANYVESITDLKKQEIFRNYYNLIMEVNV